MKQKSCQVYYAVKIRMDTFSPQKTLPSAYLPYGRYAEMGVQGNQTSLKVAISKPEKVYSKPPSLKGISAISLSSMSQR